MNRTRTTAAAISALTLLTSCATHPDGRRITLMDRWNAMAARQDAAARDFVNTETDGDPSAHLRNQATQGPSQFGGPL